MRSTLAGLSQRERSQIQPIMDSVAKGRVSLLPCMAYTDILTYDPIVAGHSVIFWMDDIETALKDIQETVQA